MEVRDALGNIKDEKYLSPIDRIQLLVPKAGPGVPGRKKTEKLPSNDLICWMQGYKPAEGLKALRRGGAEMTLDKVFQMSTTSGICSVRSLESLDKSDVDLKTHPRPAGYAAQTRIHLADVTLPAILDSGASCSAIPEEIVCGIVSCFMSTATDRDSDESWPVRRIEKYTHPTHVSGLGKDSSMVTRYAVVLRISLVGIGASWEGAPFRDIYFKVLPLGTAQVPGCLIGFPALDSPQGAPGALGWKPMPDHHLCEGVGASGVAMP